jgi:hypothetical protein
MSVPANDLVVGREAREPRVLRPAIALLVVELGRPGLARHAFGIWASSPAPATEPSMPADHRMVDRKAHVLELGSIVRIVFPSEMTR